jgi:hypothetical protein
VQHEGFVRRVEQELALRSRGLDDPCLHLRRARLCSVFASVPPDRARTLPDGLRRRRPANELSRAFHDRLVTATRIELLRILAMNPAPAPVPPTFPVAFASGPIAAPAQPAATPYRPPAGVGLARSGPVSCASVHRRPLADTQRNDVLGTDRRVNGRRRRQPGLLPRERQCDGRRARCAQRRITPVQGHSGRHQPLRLSFAPDEGLIRTAASRLHAAGFQVLAALKAAILQSGTDLRTVCTQGGPCS